MKPEFIITLAIDVTIYAHNRQDKRVITIQFTENEQRGNENNQIISQFTVKLYLL